MFKNISFVFLFAYSYFFAQEQSYLDRIINLKDNISKKQFLDTIIHIPYDKAMLNTKKYLELTKEATQLALELNDKSKIAKAYKTQSLAYHFSSNFDLSIKNTIKAAELFEEINDIENFATSYLDLGWRLKNQDLKKATFYMHKGIVILEKNNPKLKALIAGYNNYGTLKGFHKELDSAIFYHKKSLYLAKELNDQIGIPFAQTNIANIYLKQQKFILAENYLNKALHYRKDRNDIYGVTDSYLYLGDLYFEQKAFNKAIYYFEKGLNLSKKHNYFPLKKYATKLLYQSFDSLKDYKKSLFFYQNFIKLKDSVDNINLKNKIATLEIEFESTLKQKIIAEQELAIETKNLYTIILGSLLLLLGVIFFFIYKKNQFKRRQLQKEIELKEALATIKTKNKLQQQRLEISKDLHDNIGSQLTFIISSLDNLKYVSKNSTEKLLKKLAYISSFTGETIHQLRDTIWAMNNNEITIEDVHSRILSFIEKAKNAVNTIDFKVIYDIDKNASFTSLVGMNIFRIVQEAINNAIKYAEASTIKVELNKKDACFEIKIIDDGKGFDKKTVELGNGLTNMGQRINGINGNLIIDSKLNKGTTVKLKVTIENTANDV